MALNKLLPSFGAGELSPTLFGRVDLDKFHVGAALLRNFFVDFRGGVSTRAGTQFCGRAKSTSSGVPRIIPFIVSTQQTYICEFGDHYVRFYSNGAQVTEAAQTISSITLANPGVVTYSNSTYILSVGDEVVLNGTGIPQLEGRNVRVGSGTTTTFQLLDLDGNPINTSSFPAYSGGGRLGRVYTIATQFAVADLPLVKYAQSASVMTLCHPNYPPVNLSQVTSSTFAFSPVVAGPVQLGPGNLTISTNGTGSDHITGYAVTAVSLDGKEESLAARFNVVSGQFGQTGTTQAKLTWTAPATPSSYYKIYKWDQIANTSPTPTVYGFINEATTTAYTDLAWGNTGLNGPIAPDYTRNPPQFRDPFSPGQLTSCTASGGTFPISTFTSPLTFSGGGGTGAAGYVVIDPNGWTAVGAVLTSPGSGYTSNPTAIATLATGQPTFNVTLGPQTGTYPACVAYFQQRRVFGGSISNPDQLVFSQVGNYNNFDTAVVSQASDAITVSLASKQVNEIKSMTAMSTGMVVLTSGGAFLVSGGSPSAAISPATVTALPQASSGANDLPPIVVNYDILYVQNRGTIVRDLAFNFYTQSYIGSDRTQLANHLFFNHTLVDWAYAEEPYKVIWAVRDDGVLLSLTYVPEQEVYAWAHHDTQGSYKYVASVPETNINATYFVVGRTIGGATKYFIERLDNRYWTSITDAWCVDAGLAYSGSPVTSMSGLFHLVGQSVVGLADGQVVGPLTVSATGQVTLPTAASKVKLGLSYQCQLQTMYLDVQDPTGTIQGKRKLIPAATVRLYNSRGLKAGTSFSALVQMSDVPSANLTPPAPFFTGDLRQAFISKWDKAGQVCLQQDNPLPATVLAIMPEFVPGDTQR